MGSSNGSTISPNSKTRSEQDRQIQLDSTFHTADGGASGLPSSAKLTFAPYHTRHAKQLCNGEIARLNDLGGLMIDATEYCACYTVDGEAQKLLSLNNEPLFQSHLYLFSMVIALEWQPSGRTLQQIQEATKNASNFLYDVTDGFMAIGQVIVGGRGLLDVADIQVMASNRFHPRSWISALHQPHKYQPIRLGRGLWQKDQGFVIPWNESDAYRVLVHEWGHYALELVDEYLDIVRLDRDNPDQSLWRAKLVEDPAIREPTPNSLDIVAPSIALPVESIMATLGASELSPRHGPRAEELRSYMLGKIQNHFPKVAPPEPLEGPAGLPLPELPLFKPCDQGIPPEEIQLSRDDLSNLKACLISPPDPDKEIAGSSWVYVLKSGGEGDQGRIVGQGVMTKDDLNAVFTLLGAAIGDQVVVVAQIANERDQTSRVKVIRGELVNGDTAGKPPVEWHDATPDALPDFIDVLPELTLGLEQLPTRLRVQIEMRSPPSEVLVSALGQAAKPLSMTQQTGLVDSSAGKPYPDGDARARWISEPVELNHLDGHILLRWENGQKMYICNYSHGGGPCTSGGGYCVCYTAGSYEGNSMIFYRDNYDASDQADRQLTAERVSDEGTRVVSTLMHGGLQYLGGGSGDPAEARSYLFSIGSNQPLNKHSATLVLYYDNDARKQGGDLLIYRWDGSNGWQRLTTYAPENRPYLCLPLDEATPETSGGTNGREGEYFDRYRIYWTPDS